MYAGSRGERVAASRTPSAGRVPSQGEAGRNRAGRGLGEGEGARSATTGMLPVCLLGYLIASLGGEVWGLWKDGLRLNESDFLSPLGDLFA